MSAVEPPFAFEWSAPAERFIVGLEKWALLVQDWRPVFHQASAALYASEEEHFATEGRSTGGAFAKLAPGYARRKAKTYPGRPILTAAGNLRRALTRQGAPGGIRRISRTMLEQGVRGSVSGARYHASGTSRMPRRDPLRIVTDPRRPGFARNLLNIMQGEVVAARRRALGSL